MKKIHKKIFGAKKERSTPNESRTEVAWKSHARPRVEQ